jgi:hypothetical protein
MEHNFVGYAKYYSCGNIKISGGSEFTRQIDYNKKIKFRQWQVDVRNKLYFELGTIA